MHFFGLRRSIAALTLAAVGGALMAGCGGGDGEDTASTDSSTGKASKDVTMLIPYRESIAAIGLSVAMDRYYPEMGLNVNLEGTDGTAQVAQQVIAGNAKFGVTGTVETMIAQAKGQDLVSVAALGHDLFSIVAPEGSDVKAFADLDGKTIGITDLGGGEVPLVKAASPRSWTD
jgi:NitT/TauT family transport system substrate-binding protein